jgi:hypothetical protein
MPKASPRLSALWQAADQANHVIRGSITLADVAARTDTLAVACSRCDRAGRYPVATLIGRHGGWFTVPALLRILSADCPKRQQSVSAYDLCGVHCPDLPALFPAGMTVP